MVKMFSRSQITRNNLVFATFFGLVLAFSVKCQSDQEVPEMTCEIEGLEEDVARSNIYDRNKLWKDGKIPYQFGSGFTEDARKVFFQAVAQFHEKTCIRWVPRQQEPGYVEVWVDYNTSAPCGRAHSCNQFTRQIIAMSHKCLLITHIVHEMMHTLCFLHEHQRTDRDDFLTFSGCNKIPQIHQSQVNDGGIYDYWSAMSYQCGKNSCSGYPTLGLVNRCGIDVNKEGLGVLDVDKINHFYDCQDACQSHRWYNPLDMPDGDPRWQHLVNFAGEGEEHVYVCRGYSGDFGEIFTGFFRKSERSCQLGYHTAKKHIQVLALPNGPHPVTGKSRPYYLLPLKEPEYVKADKSVPTGRYYNRASFLAVAKVADSTGAKKRTLVGKTGIGWTLAHFIDPLENTLMILEEFSVLSCG